MARDADCIAFLQWALPRLGLRWTGYRKVRGQVCKRLRRRLTALGINNLEHYRALLATSPPEWQLLESLCWITISRFWRDRGVYQRLESHVVPRLAALVRARGEGTLRCWSAGCAGGEEPYSLSILWHLGLAGRFPDLGLEIVASDASAVMLRRARIGCYQGGSLKDLPAAWRDAAFEQHADRYCLRPALRCGVSFRRQDLRRRMPNGPFHLILCRNLAFTYFDEEEQRRVLGRLARRLPAGGALVLGKHERLPADSAGFAPWDGHLACYRREGP